MCAYLMVVTTCLFLSGSATPPASTAAELLGQWTGALDACSSKSFIAQGQSTTEQEFKYTNNPRRPGVRNVQDGGTSYRRIEYRRDGTRMHLREYAWGYISFRQPAVAQEQPSYQCLNYTDRNELYRHSATVGRPGGSVTVLKVDSYKTRAVDFWLQGYILPSHERTDSILRRAPSVAVRANTERIDDRDCRVLEAKTKNGTVSLWLDPARGCCLVKAEVITREGDLEYGRPVRAGWVHTLRFGGFRYEDVNGVRRPMEVISTSDLDYGDGSFTRSKARYRRTRILLNPDHQALGSFENPLEHPENDPELQNGTRVQKQDSPIACLWQDGKLIPAGRPSGAPRLRPGVPNRGTLRIRE
jgi:hypothetical protein